MGDQIPRESPEGDPGEGLTWRWLFADQAGVAISEPDATFADQDEAEEWLQGHFDELAGDGVATVSLMDGEHAIYGPMYLTPEGDGPIAEAEL